MFVRFIAVLIAGMLIFTSQVFSLTNSDVEKFIETTSQLAEYFDDIEEDGEEDERDYGAKDFDIKTIMQEFIDGMTGHAEMQKIIRSGGFSSIQEWAETATKVFMALATIELKSNLTEFEEGMEALKKEYESMGMTKEQIEMYEMQVRSSMMQFQQASESDIETVTPYLDRIKKVLDWE